jgi:hypothetical protein
MIGSARRIADEQFCKRTVARLPQLATERLEELVDEHPEHSGVEAAVGGGLGLFAELRGDPGPAGLDSLLGEIARLERTRAVWLPAELFSEPEEKRVALWRARAAAEHPSWLRGHPREVRLTLLACFCFSRTSEITDSLVDLLIATVHKMDARADYRVEQELVADLKHVRGKWGLLYALAQAALEHPDETVRRAIWPVVGEERLNDLVREAQANDHAFRGRVRTVLRSSYGSHYRKMLPPVLGALHFRCNNTAHRPLMEALELLRRYAQRERIQFYDPAERVPIDGVVKPEWRQAVVDERGGVERIPYELSVLISLREAIRRREIWIEGSRRWGDPETDLPQDFDERREQHYAALSQPLDPTVFIDKLKADLDAALKRLSNALRRQTAGGVRITTRKGDVWIRVPKLGKLPEAPGLQALKREIVRRWGVIDLLDVLKEIDYLTGFTSEFTTVATRENIPREQLGKRLLLALFALGTNMGISKLVAAGEHGEDRGHAQAHPPDPHQPRQPPRGDHPHRQRHARAPRPAMVGERDHDRLRLQAVRLLGLQPDDRVPRPLRRPRRDDLLARREEAAVHPQPAHDLLRVRGRRDARRAPAPLHRGGDRGQLHRHARRLGHRLRVLPPARLPPAAQAQEHRQRHALPPR